MSDQTEEELFNEFLRVFIRKEAYRRIKKMLKPKVTKKEIFDFHNNLTTIVEDSEDPQECYDREIDYIYHWLKLKDVEVEQ